MAREISPVQSAMRRTGAKGRLPWVTNSAMMRRFKDRFNKTSSEANLKSLREIHNELKGLSEEIGDLHHSDDIEGAQELFDEFKGKCQKFFEKVEEASELHSQATAMIERINSRLQSSQDRNAAELIHDHERQAILNWFGREGIDRRVNALGNAVERYSQIAENLRQIVESAYFREMAQHHEVMVRSRAAFLEHHETLHNAVHNITEKK
ncbi:MAG: hypothetical protein QXR53_02275 [Candidatus Norongarragalinales archaeon]